MRRTHPGCLRLLSGRLFCRTADCPKEYSYRRGILGSSDLDQTSKPFAKLQTDLLMPMVYPLIRDGRFKSRFLQKQLEKRTAQMGSYGKAFMAMLGGARQYVTKRSCKNQFYSDLITPLPDKLDVPGTQIHIFYALKMGEKYRTRYERHFAHPIIHEQELRHEELLACYPEQWAELVKSIVFDKGNRGHVSPYPLPSGACRPSDTEKAFGLPENETKKLQKTPEGTQRLEAKQLPVRNKNLYVPRA